MLWCPCKQDLPPPRLRVRLARTAALPGRFEYQKAARKYYVRHQSRLTQGLRAHKSSDMSNSRYRCRQEKLRRQRQFWHSRRSSDLRSLSFYSWTASSESKGCFPNWIRQCPYITRTNVIRSCFLRPVFAPSFSAWAHLYPTDRLSSHIASTGCKRP